MYTKSQFFRHYILHAVSALLTLGLFDSNPWWSVLLFSLLAVFSNVVFLNLARQNNYKKMYKRIVFGILPAFLAHLASLTPFFRTTFGTLVGYALLLYLLGFLFAPNEF